ncbi:hypothetical protein [Streptomyces sp. NPDC001312]|uniref:hypothetical protein n=1 Tax=Streptomyces sp. NPDC001312 TaxID=3364561 RepID=UPI0036742C75
MTAEVEHLAAERIPAAARQTAHPRVVVPGPLEPGTTGTPPGVALEGVLSALAPNFSPSAPGSTPPPRPGCAAPPGRSRPPCTGGRLSAGRSRDVGAHCSVAGRPQDC